MTRVMVVGYLIGAFRLWMIHDALRRRVHTGWYFALLFPVPLSDLVYFFAIKMRDFGLHPSEGDAARDAQLKLTGELAKLERAVEQSPSFQNRVLLGWALYERETHGRRKRSSNARSRRTRATRRRCSAWACASSRAARATRPSRP